MQFTEEQPQKSASRFFVADGKVSTSPKENFENLSQFSTKPLSEWAGEVLTIPTKDGRDWRVIATSLAEQLGGDTVHILSLVANDEGACVSVHVAITGAFDYEVRDASA
jgi:hypothetical protein